MSEIQPGLRHNQNFLKLWGGQSVSLAGTQVTYIALPLLAIYAINAGAFDVGLIGLAQGVPYLLVTLWAGAWIDQCRRIPVMLVVDIVRALLLVALVVLALTHVLTLAMMLAIILVFGTGSVLFEVSYYSLLPSIVNRSDLMTANSRLQTSMSFAIVTGPNIGGLLTQLITAPFALLVDAFSFLTSAVTLRWMRVDESVPEPAVRGASRIKQIREGLTYVARSPMLRTLTIGSALYNFFTNWVMTLFPVFAVRDLELKAGAIGFVQSFGAIGSVVGAVFAARMIRKLGAGTAYIVAKALAWASVLTVALTPAHSAYTLTVLVVAFSVSGMLIVSNVVGVTLRQAVTADNLLGRMNATYKFVSFGAQSVGAFIGGLIGGLGGLRASMVIGGVGLVSTVLVSLSPALRGIRDLPTEPDEQPMPDVRPSFVQAGNTPSDSPVDTPSAGGVSTGDRDR